MPYATRADMEARFRSDELVQLTDEEGTGLLDDAVLAKALGDTDAEIDGYLVGRYVLPLSTVPANLARIACDIARYRLYKDAAPDEVVTRYKAAIRYLEQVASGAISLGPDVTGASQAPASGGPDYVTPGRTFDDDTLSIM